MTNLKKFFARLRKDQDGATMVEYSILIGIITAAVIGFVIAVGGYVETSWTGLCDALEADGATCP